MTAIGKLLFCVAGIYFFFLTWGLLQERISTMKYVNAAGESGSFRFFQVLNMVQAFLAAGLAFSQLLVQRMPLCGPVGQAHALTPQLIFNFFKIALASSVGSSLGYRSLKHINYPTMILGKSCKLVPVMLMNFLIYRKRFEAHKYFTVALITAGVSGFMLFEDTKGKQSSQGNSWFGLALLLANLLLDGTTNSWQDQLFLKYRLRSQQLMMFMNLFSGALLAGSLLLECALKPTESQLFSAFAFARAFPSVIPDILAFSACGALGQLFIFYTLEQYGSLMLVTVTVTRKLFTILLSLFWFAHAVNWRQWACVGAVFVALVMEAVIGKAQKGKKSDDGKEKEKSDEPEFQSIQDGKFLVASPEKEKKKKSSVKKRAVTTEKTLQCPGQVSTQLPITLPSPMTTSTIQRPNHVVVHPLVLLSVVDHYRRAAMGTKKRVVGVLLGNWTGQTVNVTNSYAVPFEEDENVWFLDHNYHESMNELSKKVNAKERPVGWYHTGPKLRASDLAITEVFRKYCTHACPTLLIVDPMASEDRIGLPFDAFAAVDTLSQQEGNSLVAETAQKVFVHLPSVVEAEEAEEIGVEHLLRDVKDNVVGDLSTKITQKTDSLRALQQQLNSIMEYLRAVQAGKTTANPAIIYRLQEMFNLLPDVHSQEALKALQVAANDQAMMLYAGGLVQTVIALHELVNNKLENVQ